jgi:hypothetical protein
MYYLGRLRGHSARFSRRNRGSTIDRDPIQIRDESESSSTFPTTLPLSYHFQVPEDDDDGYRCSLGYRITEDDLDNARFASSFRSSLFPQMTPGDSLQRQRCAFLIITTTDD